MKRSVLILGIVTALMIPASLAVAQSEDAPVMKQGGLGDGNPANCSYYLEKGEPQLVRLQDGIQTQAGARWGDGPMGSEEAPFQRNGFGPGECDGDCNGEGPFGPFGSFGPGECDGDCNGEGPFGPFGLSADDAPHGPFGDQDGSGDGHGPGTAGEGAGPQAGTGNQFGPGPSGGTTASPGGSAHQHGAGAGGNK